MVSVVLAVELSLCGANVCVHWLSLRSPRRLAQAAPDRTSVWRLPVYWMDGGAASCCVRSTSKSLCFLFFIITFRSTVFSILVEYCFKRYLCVERKKGGGCGRVRRCSWSCRDKGGGGSDEAARSVLVYRCCSFSSLLFSLSSLPLLFFLSGWDDQLLLLTPPSLNRQSGRSA